ncbi:MAG: hypothetical protein ACRCTA_03005, partial [Bacilli bacterium]
MKFMQRVGLSIIRVYSKTLILFSVTTILALGIILSFLIRSGINETKKSMQKNLNLGVVINIMGDDKVNSKAKELYDNLSKSPYVDYYDYGSSFSNASIKEAKGSEVKDLEETSIKSFTFKGIQNPNLIPIKNERAQLEAGRLLSVDEIKNGSKVAIISSAFSKANNYQVGDKLKVQVALMEDAIQNGDEFYIGGEAVDENSKLVDFDELEIVGIINIDESKIPINQEITKGDKKLISKLKAMELDSIYTPNTIVKDMGAKAIEH